MTPYSDPGARVGAIVACLLAAIAIGMAAAAMDEPERGLPGDPGIGVPGPPGVTGPQGVQGPAGVQGTNGLDCTAEAMTAFPVAGCGVPAPPGLVP